MQMGDFEDVGLSLFRGMDTLQIDQDSEHLEQEAVEEQRRRNEELRSILKQTFADLSFDDDEEEEDDDDEDDSGRDDDSDINSSDSYDSRCRDNVRQHQGESRVLPQTSQEESRILPPRPVTEGSVMFPENGHPTPQWDTSTDNVLPPKVCKESGELNQGSLESSLDGPLRVTSRPADVVTSTPSAVPSFLPTTAPDANEVYRQAGYDNGEQLRVLYEVRTREVQRLSQEVEVAKAEAAAEADALRRRLVSCEADKNNLQLQLQNAQGLLAEHKGKRQELEAEVETLKRNIFNLESSKKQLETQLTAAQASVVELQHKVLLLERSRLGDSREVLRQLEERHRADVDALQRQLRERTAQLHDREKEAAEREGRLREQNREQERLLVEKGEAVAALVRQLDEAQRGAGQAGALRAEAEAARRDAQHAREQLAAAQQEVERLKSDLKQYEVLDSLGLLSAGGDSTVDRGARGSGGGGSFHAKLRQELQRSLTGQKVKREEIQRLQQQLRERDRQLQEREQTVTALRRQQELYLQEANKFKEEVDKLYTQLAHRDSADGCADPDTEAARQEVETKRAELEEAKAEARTLAERLAAAEAQLREAQEQVKANSKEEFLRFHEQAIAKMRREHDEQMTGLQCQLEKCAEECDQVKQMYVEVCSSKELLLRGAEEERATWEAERAQLQRQADQLKARLDLYAGRVSQEIDRAKQAAMAAVAAEDKKKPESCSVSVQATISPLPSPVAGDGSCPSCEALRQQASFLEGRTKGLTEELCRRQAELRESRGRAASLQRELTQLAEKREFLEAEIVKYKQKLKDVSQSEEDLRRKESELASETQRAARLEAQLQGEREAAVEARRHAGALEAEVERLQQELAREHEAAQRRTAEVEALRQRAESLQRELQQAGAGGEAAQLRERLAEAERTAAEAEKRAADVSVRLTAELTAARNLCEQLADRLQEGRVDKKDSETCTEWEYPDLEQLKARHLAEIERIKDQTVDYFANQVLQLQEQHRMSLAKAEQLHAESLQAARLAAVEAREQATAARLHKEESEKHLQHVQKTLTEVKADLARIRSKYHTAKKVVHDYKEWAQKREEQCRQEWRRLEEGYRASLLQLQQRMDHVLARQGKEQAPGTSS